MSWSVVIPSGRAENLVRAVASILKMHPDLDPSRIVVVEDGARAGAESKLPKEIAWIEGPKPFVFARNVNLGVERAAPHDAIVMGDDVEVRTPRGFDLLADHADRNPRVGILAPGIHGFVGNPNQLNRGQGGFRAEARVLAFICVLIPRRVWVRIGPMDETFQGYGFDDNDYCLRVRNAGLEMGVLDDCAVSHGEMPSVYRMRPDFDRIFKENEARMREKWKEPSP